MMLLRSKILFKHHMDMVDVYFCIMSLKHKVGVYNIGKIKRFIDIGFDKYQYNELFQDYPN